MTKKESAIIGAYTGILVGPFDALHEYIENLMMRPVFTHELGQKWLAQEVKTRSRDDFIKLVSSISDE